MTGGRAGTRRCTQRVCVSNRGALPFDEDACRLEEWVRGTGPSVLERLGIRAGMKVLDVGCGFGAWARCLLRLGADVTAIDVSLDMVRVARDWNADVSGGRLSAVCVDARDFLAACPAGRYDAVLLFDVLHLLRPWRPLLAEVSRVVRRDGVLAVNPGLSHHLDGDDSLELAAVIVENGFCPRVRFDAHVVHYRRFSRDRVWGFRKVDVRVSSFQGRVLAATWFIPAGRVTSYGVIAGRIGCGSPRAVGQALRRNPFAPFVPCHRVISSDLSPGGFRGGRDGAVVQEKMERLAAEGVFFRDGRLQEPERMFRF